MVPIAIEVAINDGLGLMRLWTFLCIFFGCRRSSRSTVVNHGWDLSSDATA